MPTPSRRWWRRQRNGVATAFSSSKALSSHSRAVWAFVIVSSVVKVFEGDYEKCLRGIKIASGLGKVCAVDIGDETKSQIPLL